MTARFHVDDDVEWGRRDDGVDLRLIANGGDDKSSSELSVDLKEAIGICDYSTLTDAPLSRRRGVGVIAYGSH